METLNPNMETLYYRLIEDYKNTLLYPVNVYYKNSIKELVSKNNTLQNSVQQGFYLDGSFYTSEDYPTKNDVIYCTSSTGLNSPVLYYHFLQFALKSSLYFMSYFLCRL